MATLRVLNSRRLGTERSEFEVEVSAGAVAPHEVFQFIEKGTVWEYVVVEVRPLRQPQMFLVSCMNWVPESGAFTGMTATSRPMKASQRKRYGKRLPAA